MPTRKNRHRLSGAQQRPVLHRRMAFAGIPHLKERRRFTRTPQHTRSDASCELGRPPSAAATASGWRFATAWQETYKNSLAGNECEGPYESCKQYFLYDYFPEHDLFLVHVSYYESQNWLLVRRSNGNTEKVVAPPHYSPGKKWLASVNWTEGPDDGNNGIDIVSTNPAQRSFHYRPNEYELWEFVKWDGDDRLVLTVTWRVSNEPELVTWPAEIVRVRGEWQVNRWAPLSPQR